MTTCSIGFVLFAAVLAIVIPSMPRIGVRQYILGAANLVFLLSLVTSISSAVSVLLFVLATYLALWLLRKKPFPGMVPATICIVVLVFLILRRYTFLNWMLSESTWAQIPEVIGISYMLFKFIHMVVDQSQGQLAPFTFLSYVNYQGLCFTLTAGPIQRYNDFYQYWTSRELPALDTREALNCWNRLLTGMIKVAVLAGIALYLFEGSRTQLLADPHNYVLGRFAIFFYSYAIFMYFNFSGYTDIVIAAARLIGLTLPENFNRPYIARNVIDFWNRWHITLTHWIRDYIFMTSYKAVAEQFPHKAKQFGYGLLFLSLFLAGVWHGSTTGFIVFGAIHGIGAATNQLYGDMLRTWLGREGFNKYLKNRFYRVAAILLTVHYVCFAFMFFSCGVNGARQILGIVGRAIRSLPATNVLQYPGVFGWSLVVLVPLVILVGVRRDAILSRINQFGDRVTARNRSLYLTVVMKTLFISCILIFLWGLEKEPEIVYMRF
jgi:D-alanyl-lipoteichoic acid acyltransferase DltB (MBOAT superfamily)